MEVETRTNEIIYNEIISLKIRQDEIFKLLNQILELLKLIKKDVAYSEEDEDFNEDNDWHTLSSSSEEEFLKKRPKLSQDSRFSLHSSNYPVINKNNK